MDERRVALLELYASHVETIYSQIRFLQQGGYKITLIISRAHTALADQVDKDIDVIFTECHNKEGLALWKDLWQIRRHILDCGAATVILNTAHSNPVRNLCLLPFPRRMFFAGTLHGVNKLNRSVTQRIISRRIPNYFLLSDYMHRKALSVPHAGLRFAVYYPIFHPEFQPVPIDEKPAGQIWICIPGHVEFKRRDYTSLIEAFAALESKPDVRFIVLGNGSHSHGNGPELRRMISERGLTAYFRFFDGFVSEEEFHTYVQASDVVMPLTHPLNADLMKYAEDQISGSFNLAFAYKKPLLMHRFYERYPDFAGNSLFYDMDGLSVFLAQFREMLAQRNDWYTESKWSLASQAEGYLRLLAARPHKP